ncbi:hypothetical protein ACFL3V_01800 [Nanoarchaeota archaeon]
MYCDDSQMLDGGLCQLRECEYDSAAGDWDASCEPGFCDFSIEIESTPDAHYCHRVTSCQSSVDCTDPDDDCVAGHCLTDQDEDSFYRSTVPDTFVPEAVKDCDDDSNLCGWASDPLCFNSDGSDNCYAHDLGDCNNNNLGERDLWMLDCRDICIDADGDAFCAANSALWYDSNLLSKPYGPSQTDLTEAGFREFSGTIIDTGYEENFDDGPDDDVGNLAGLYQATEPYEFIDCDDYNADINPFVPEGEYTYHCNLINDDCDDSLDECTGPDEQCVYLEEYGECYDWDADGDEFNNEDFSCPDCTDCADDDPAINPSVVESLDEDDGDGGYTGNNGEDDNCNGLIDEVDANGDGVPEEFILNGVTITLDECDDQDESEGPTAPNGCWFSILKDTLPDWRIGGTS